MVFRKGLVFVVSGTTISSQNIEICSFYSHLNVGSGGPHSASRRPPNHTRALSVVPTYFLSSEQMWIYHWNCIEILHITIPHFICLRRKLKKSYIDFFFSGLGGPPTHIFILLVTLSYVLSPEQSWIYHWNRIAILHVTIPHFVCLRRKLKKSYKEFFFF